ncbi:MAG: PAS domain S-box protein, partial [Deltaproteobacteria bacterium]|nr:PAS domain S-box protein [Deltaproteobacteria bacterium]
GVSRIISGDYRFSLSGFPRDEIGDLADKFNQMVEKLRTDRQRRKLAERELRESEKRYRMVANFAYDMECWRDVDGRMIYVSPSCESLTGYSPAEFLADPRLMEKLVLPEDRPVFIDHNHEMTLAGLPKPIEFRIRHKDGRIRWFNHICRPVFDESGENLGIRGSNRDVTEQKLATESLAAEREKLAVTLRSIADGVITVDNQGRVTMLNRAAEKMTGWPQQEAVGRPLEEVFQVVSEYGHRPLANPVAIALREKKTTELSDNSLLVTRDGRQLVIGDSAAPIIDLAGETIGAVLVFRDLTDKRRLLDEMRKAEKIESIGLLAGGIAHDFNNLLQGIRGSLSLSLANEEQLPPLVIRNLQRAEEATRQASALAQQLLTFSRGGEPQVSEIDLQPLVVEAANFVLHGSNVVVRYEFEPDLHRVLADPGQIGQVVHNLVLNAKQAMNDSGVISIRAGNFTVKPDEPWYGLPAGSYVKIHVHDQGPGIPQEIIDKVFDPYFTTKEDGRGLGLATCYSIIKNHGGHISISSVLGDGTTFVIFLPAIEKREEVPEPAPEETESPAAAPATGRILVMDDEELIREIACEMLAMAGYQPTGVADGAAAVKLYRQAMAAGEPFAAVISDLTVPGGMGGQEMAREILRFDADARIIVSSGYASDAVLANYRQAGFVAVINKPYKMAELLKVLQQVLPT